MDRYTDWPWSWEEEIEWKADLEQRDNDFLEELINEAIEDGNTDSRSYLASLPDELFGDRVSEEYSVTA